MSKPGKVLRTLCKKLGVRLTVKRGKKRVYKSVAVLKAQCKRKKKKKKVKRKRRRKFGTERNTKRIVYIIGEHHGYNHTQYLLNKLFLYLKRNGKVPYIFTEYGMVIAKEYKNVPDYTNYLIKMFGKNFIQNNIIQVDKDKNSLVNDFVNTSLGVIPRRNGVKLLLFNIKNIPDIILNDGETIIERAEKIQKAVIQGEEREQRINEILSARSDEEVDNVIKKNDKIPGYEIFFDQNDKNEKILSKKIDSFLNKFDVLKQNLIKHSKGVDTKEYDVYLNNIDVEFEEYKRLTKTCIENYFDYLRQRESIIQYGKMGKDDFEKLEKYFYIASLGYRVTGIITNFHINNELNRLKNKINKDGGVWNVLEKYMTKVDSSVKLISQKFNWIFKLIIKIRDHNLIQKIKKYHSKVNNDNPFLVILGRDHLENYYGLWGKLNIKEIYLEEKRYLADDEYTTPGIGKYDTERMQYRKTLERIGIVPNKQLLRQGAYYLKYLTNPLENWKKTKYNSFSKRVKRKRKRKSKRKRKVKRKRKKRKK